MAEKQNRMGSKLQIILKRIGICVLLLIAFAWISYRSLQTQPSFYQEALAADPILMQASGDRFENKAIELNNQLMKMADWQMELSQDEVNGWFGFDMPQKFPNTLPSFVKEPRASITAEELKIACQVNQAGFSCIVVCVCEVFPIESEQNSIGIVFKKLYSGWFPLPITRFTDQISESMLKAGIPIRWSQQDGKPMAVVRLEFEHPQVKNSAVLVETVTLKEKAIFISGTVK